jgi:hypothetical protein
MIHERTERLRAKLACYGCARSATTIRVSGSPQRRWATAECTHCQRRTSIVLTDDLAAALWRFNRSVGYVHFTAESI